MSGVRREWMAPENFVMIHLDLVDMGLSLEAALLLQRIYFRSNIGDGWWLATKADMQADSRLSEWKLDRAIKELREHEMVEWRRKDATNPTLAWRVVWTEEPPSREGGNLPQVEEGTSVTSTKNSKNNPPTPPGGTSAAADGARKRSSTKLDAESEAMFEAFWSLYPRKVDKGHARKAFGSALKKAPLSEIGPGLERAVAAWRADGTETTKIPHAATWLNGERWTDELPTPGGSSDDGEDTSWMHRTN